MIQLTLDVEAAKAHQDAGLDEHVKADFTARLKMLFLEEMPNLIARHDVTPNISGNFVGDDGNLYTNLRFAPTATFTRNDDRYYTNGTFLLNATAMIDTLNKL